MPLSEQKNYVETHHQRSPMAKYAPVRNCPFCGSGRMELWADRYHLVHCTHCDANGPVGDGETEQAEEADAIAKWNRRRR